MFEKDYIMRLVQYLTDAVKRINESIDNDDYEDALKRLSASYEVLGNDAIYFKEESVDTIIYFFKKQGKDYLKKLELIAELLLLEKELSSSLTEKVNLSMKSKEIYEFCIDNSNEYSYYINQKMALLKKELK
jgi:hypothetical protein